MAADESADKAYYRSRDRSVFAQRGTPVSRKGRLGEPLESPADPPDVPGDTHADKYYATGGSRMQRQMTAKPNRVSVDSSARPASGGAYSTALESDLRRPLLVRDGTPANIRSVVEHVVSLLQSGTSPVVVQVADAQFEADVRTGLDIRVARETITRDQYRDVQFSLIPKTASELADRAFGKIDPAKLPVVKVDDDPEAQLPDDFAAFVRDDNEEPLPSMDPAGSSDLADDTDDDVPVASPAHPDYAAKRGKMEGRELSPAEADAVRQKLGITTVPEPTAERIDELPAAEEAATATAAEEPHRVGPAAKLSVAEDESDEPEAEPDVTSQPSQNAPKSKRSERRGKNTAS